MIPQVMEEFNLSYAIASLPMSLVGLVGFFFALPTWVLMFRWGLKKIGTLGLFIGIIGGMISSLGGSFLLIVFGRILLGFGTTVAFIVSFSMIVDLFSSRESGIAMGIKGLEMPVAAVLTLNLIPIVIAIHGWRASFIISTCLLIISTAFFILLFKEKPLRKSRAKMFRGVWNKQMWLLGLIWSFTMMGISAYSTWAGTFFIDIWEMPVNVAFFMASILMITAIPLWPLIGIISDRLGRRKIFIIVSSFLMGISLILMSILPGTLLYLPIALLAVSSFSVPIIFALTSEILPKEQAGLGFGILFMCSNVGVSLGTILVGFVEDLFPLSGVAFFLMGVFSFLALLCVKFLKVR